uniref:Uncharacterized protein n=1 Tax=viral metagenome TaxID=1070528 RepID=A0A6C0J144_9ZZZZ
MVFITDSNNYITNIDNIFKNKSYHYVYVSIGSKYNQQDVYFYSSSMPLAKRVDTNAVHQMVPLFLYTKPSSKNILNITIDIFSTEYEIQFNKRLIESTDIENMDNLIINMSCNKANLNAFGEHILSTLMNSNILEPNFMLCNYVKFANSPNPEEFHAEKKIPIYLEKLFKDKYMNSYYEWYGYNYNLYNCIYNVSYGKSDIYLYKTKNDLNNIIDLLCNQNIQKKINDQKIIELMANSYDISVINEIEPMIGFSHPISKSYI